MGPSHGAPAPKYTWGCGSVRWKQIFRYQSHGAWIVLLAAIIVTAVSHFSITPYYRPLTLYDASISLPLSSADTVSIELAGIIPFVATVITVLAVEFGAMYRRQSLTMAIHAVFHTLWWAIVGFAVVLAITEATKPFASRYRPDYLNRCQPTLATGPNSKPYLTFKQSVDCDPKAKETDFVKDGRKSFPSGHSSNSLSLCWFTVLYFVHALYWRDGMRYMGSIGRSRGCARSFLGEVLQGLFIVWGLTVVSIAWCIGVTRFRDNRHNIDDILGGFMAALLWMTPCTFIALGQLNYYQQQLQKEEEEEAEQLPTMASGSAASGGSYGKGTATEPISHVAPMDRYETPDHTAVPVPPQHSGSGKGTGYQAKDGPSPGAAAAADVRPAHLQNLTSDIDDHAGVTPVADTNGQSFKY